MPKPVSEIEEAIRRHKLRATPGRVAVLRLMRSTEVPLSQLDIVERLGAAGRDRATVYRNLNRFTSVGLVRRVDLGDRVWRFIAPGGGDRVLGGTFECTVCGTRFPLPEIELRVPREAPRAIVRKQIEIRITGACNDCI